ncbi:sensor histidine kinase [Arthrobacter sp. D2-10]
MGRGITAFSLLLLLQAGGSIAAQTPYASHWWNALFLWFFLTVVAGSAAASIRGRGLFWIARISAALILSGLALWPLAVPPGVPGSFGTPWMWAMINVGAAWCAFGFGARMGCLYALLIGVIFTYVRTTPQGGAAPLSLALQDALFATVLGLIICVTIGILRHAAELTDAAAEEAIERYRDAATVSALSQERLRVDALLHDSVMTSLLTAAQASSPEERAASAKLAFNALDRLQQECGGTVEATPATLSEIAARIRFAVGGNATHPVVTVTSDSGEDFLLPAEVVEAVFEAATEAVKNSKRHSRASRCEVRLKGHRTADTKKISVTVRDNGAGFDYAQVSDRRLGIRISIVGRIEAAGGSAKVHTAPGIGTEVRMDWEWIDP